MSFSSSSPSAIPRSIFTFCKLFHISLSSEKTDIISSYIVFFSSENSWFWDKYPILIDGFFIISPISFGLFSAPSTLSFPSSILIIVDLPTPLSPTRPIFSFSSIEKLISFSIKSPANCLYTLLNCTKLIFSPLVFGCHDSINCKNYCHYGYFILFIFYVKHI